MPKFAAAPAKPRATGQRAADLLAQVLQLPESELLELANALVDEVGAERLREPETVRRLRRRREALADMLLAAAHHGLNAETAPTVRQYKAAYGAGKVTMSYSDTEQAFDGFRRAQAAYLVGLPRGRMHGTVAEAGTGKRIYEDAIRGVELWRKEGGSRTAMKAYNMFAAEFNMELADGQRPLLQALSVTRETGLRWSVVVKVASGEMSFEEAVEQQYGRMLDRASQAEGDMPELICTGAVSALLGAKPSHAYYLARLQDFPPYAAKLGAGRLWRLDDVLRYRDGQREWSGKSNELRTALLERRDIERLLGMSPVALDWRLQRKSWDEVPPPIGRVSTTWFWSKAGVEQWQRESEDRTG